MNHLTTPIRHLLIVSLLSLSALSNQAYANDNDTRYRLYIENQRNLCAQGIETELCPNEASDDDGAGILAITVVGAALIWLGSLAE